MAHENDEARLTAELRPLAKNTIESLLTSADGS